MKQDFMMQVIQLASIDVYYMLTNLGSHQPVNNRNDQQHEQQHKLQEKKLT